MKEEHLRAVNTNTNNKVVLHVSQMCSIIRKGKKSQRFASSLPTWKGCGQDRVQLVLHHKKHQGLRPIFTSFFFFFFFFSLSLSLSLSLSPPFFFKCQTQELPSQNGRKHRNTRQCNINSRWSSKLRIISIGLKSPPCPMSVHASPVSKIIHAEAAHAIKMKVVAKLE